jgi:hypothetical protein
MKKTTLCTLFEGHYHYGVAALSNSLMANGYRGELWAGYRGQLADWITRHEGYDAATGQLRLSDSFSLRLVRLETPLFFAYYKPTFMREVLDQHAPDADAVAYIDPDIVLQSAWSDLTAWFEGGIGLVEDVNWNLPPRHPKRLMWSAWFAPHGVVERRTLGRYYNSGFISVPREHADFLTLWGWLCGLVADYNNGVKHIKSGDASTLFHSTDQDAMNYALMAHEAPLNTAGADAMDFLDGGYYFSHAIGGAKPWLGRHVRRALKGRPPSRATKAYYRYANHPIRLYSPMQFALRRMSLGLASAIGRFYRKA